MQSHSKMWTKPRGHRHPKPYLAAPEKNTIRTIIKNFLELHGETEEVRLRPAPVGGPQGPSVTKQGYAGVKSPGNADIIRGSLTEPGSLQARLVFFSATPRRCWCRARFGGRLHLSPARRESSSEELKMIIIRCVFPEETR